MIVIITYSDIPNGTPGAIRYYTFAETYLNMGYDVMLLNKSYNFEGSGIQAKAIAVGNRYNSYFLFSLRAINSLKKILRTKSIDGVIIGADIEFLHAFIIKTWCRQNNVKCIFDVTEWYSKEQFPRWQTAIPYWEKTLTNKYVIDKKSHVIAISSYLYNYFKEKGCKVVNIPIIYNREKNEEKYFPRVDLDDKLRVIYAGSHLLMDNILLILKAISLVPEYDRNKIQFIIYGMSEDKIRSRISEDVWDIVCRSVSIMGRKPNNVILEAYAKVDFSILLRDPTLRVNKAGFPSKVVESMRLGVPVICNYSSDLSKYLVHNENSIIVKSLTAENISKVLQDLVHLSLSEKNRIGYNAQQLVLNKLDSVLFEESFRYIISV